MEKMLVTQALDERDLLGKKIGDKTKNASFTDTIKVNEDRTYEGRESREEFAKKAEASFQQIQDLIVRYQKIEAALVASNAETYVETSYGKFTVAAAIALRARLKDLCSPLDFENRLCAKMKAELDSRISQAENKNKQLQTTAEEMRLSILGKDTKAKDDKPLAVVDAYVKENTTEILDPLDVKKKIQEMQEKHDKLLQELDTQIKVCNATTFIEI